MHHPFTALLLLSVVSAHAQSVSPRLGARAAGMGTASFTLHDESALFNNIGATAWVETPSLMFSYEVAADLPGANRTGAGILLPSSVGAWSAGAFRFGDDVYSEQLLFAGFSHRLGSTSLGVKVNFVQYKTDGFDTRSTVTMDVGGLTRLTPDWYVAAGIFNVTQASITEDEVLPVTLVAAMGWHPEGGPLLTAEVEKRAGFPLRVKGGAEFGVKKKIFFRSGFSLNPVLLSGGIGAKTRRLNLDFSTSYSEALSFFHQASATYRLRNPKDQ